MNILRDADVYYIEIKNEAGDILEKYSIINDEKIVLENNTTKKIKYKDNLMDLIVKFFIR